ncbi:hypothetical protein QTO34_012583 [Cnephaeus nilssonii]|uniref:Uncharacterized protein n=1 Tax=Cnephaeus nilssonii TaxID=3371016 RepID=A0AA40HCF1_CNENI|nr:hypothetical protein QTO34_012583 [Eptesicus nilssonii]
METHKKEGILTICSNLDGIGEHYANGDQRLFKDKEQLRPFEDEKSPTTEADSYPKTTSTRPACRDMTFPLKTAFEETKMAAKGDKLPITLKSSFWGHAGVPDSYGEKLDCRPSGRKVSSLLLACVEPRLGISRTETTRRPWLSSTLGASPRAATCGPPGTSTDYCSVTLTSRRTAAKPEVCTQNQTN